MSKLLHPTSFPALFINSPGTGCEFLDSDWLYLNDESVRKILKTQLRYEISNGLHLQSTKDQETVPAVVHTKTTLGQRNV